MGAAQQSPFIGGKRSQELAKGQGKSRNQEKVCIGLDKNCSTGHTFSVTKIQLPRQLELVDVENLLGNPRPIEAEVRECARLWCELVAADRPSQAVVACNHGAVQAVFWGWHESARRLMRSGHNGADEALLDVLREEDVSNRFDHVVIGSGDGIFSEAASWLATQGVEVTVVARPIALSRRLELAAARVIPFLRPDIFEPAMVMGRAA